MASGPKRAAFLTAPALAAYLNGSEVSNMASSCTISSSESWKLVCSDAFNRPYGLISTSLIRYLYDCSCPTLYTGTQEVEHTADTLGTSH